MISDTGLRPVSEFKRMATVLMAVVLPFLCLSCSGHGKQFGAAITNRDSASVMTTVGVDMLISEDGRLKYHVTAPEWMVFDQMKPPHYSLEKGIHLEIYNENMEVEATLVADTAYYLNNSKLWELKGHVHSQNMNGDEFDTPHMYVNNRSDKVYSDDSITIRQPNRMLKGVGFESNGNMTEYFIRHSQGVFPIEDVQPDSIPSAEEEPTEESDTESEE